ISGEHLDRGSRRGGKVGAIVAGRSQLQEQSATRGGGRGGAGATRGAAEDFVTKAIGGEASGFGNGVLVALDIEDGAGCGGADADAGIGGGVVDVVDGAEDERIALSHGSQVTDSRTVTDPGIDAGVIAEQAVVI